MAGQLSGGQEAYNLYPHMLTSNIARLWGHLWGLWEPSRVPGTKTTSPAPKAALVSVSMQLLFS